MTNELKPYRTRLPPEELRLYLYFRQRGGKVAAKKGKGSYNRNQFKKGG